MLALNWLDVISVATSVLAIALIQVLNYCLVVLNDNATITSSASVNIKEQEKTPPTTPSPLTPPTSPTSPNAPTTPSATSTLNRSVNGKLEKQSSLVDSESGISLSSTVPSTTTTTSAATTPTISATNSYSTQHHNNGYLTQTLSFDTLGDEYHEDEDTISLENLFPCDQTEIYASKKISYIIDELIQTEVNYVENLRRGITNYGRLEDCDDLPEGLRGVERQQQLLGNITEILELHEKEVLPLMMRNQRDLKGLFDEMAAHFEKNNFYCYVTFTMGKKSSMQLRQDNRPWLQNYQTAIKDKLGIDSFLVQPIQRLTRYPLLLQQFISEFYKSGISCKPVLSAVCKLETRMRRQLDVVNQAEEVLTIDELNEFDLLQQGNFRRSTEFDAQHFPTRKKYRAKVFLFDRSLVCTEIRKRRLAYRHHYNWEHVELQRPLDSSNSNANKSITLLVKLEKGAGKREEFSFVAAEASVVKQWLQTTHKIIETARYEYAHRDTFSLPMDLVVGGVLAIWLIWQYL